MNKFYAYLVLSMMGLSAASCQKKDDSAATVGLKLKLASLNTAKSSILDKNNPLSVLWSGVSTRLMTQTQFYGSSSTTNITSLKYFVFGISVCQSLTTSGTAFSSPQNCLSLYDSGLDSQSSLWSYDSSNQNYASMITVAQNNSSAMTNFMDATSRDSLAKVASVSSSQVGNYNWAIVNWYPIALMNAQVAVNGGTTTLATSGSGSVNTTSGIWTTTANIAGAAATEAPVSTGNGGTWFHFQNPLTITAADVTNKSSFSVDLAFDPDGFVKGVAGSLGGCGTCMIQNGNNGITEPILDVTPIPHLSSDSVLRETWTTTMTGATDGSYTIKLKLYYLASDTTKAIYGVNVNTYLSDSTLSFVNNFPKIASISSNTDGTINFFTWDGTTKLIQNFNRKSGVGATTTGTIKCGSLSAGGFATDDCAAGTSTNQTWTLTAVEQLN